jgi:O-antigen ligase
LEKLNKFLIFLCPVFLGLPNLAVKFSFINLRIDDIIVYLLLLLNFKILLKWKFLISYGPFYNIIRLLLFWCLFTLIKAFIIGNEIDSYELTKSIGSLPYLLVIPLLINDNTYKKPFFYGALFGLAFFLFGIYSNFLNISDISSITRSSKLKDAIAFETLNPNSISLIGVIFSFILLLGFYSLKKKYFLIFGLIGLTIPFFTFARGMSLGILVSLIVFFSLRKIKKFNSLIIFSVSLIISFNILNVNNSLVDSATSINFSTGEGLSMRDILWKQGIELFEMNPLTGSGFSTVQFMYEKYFYGHMAHNILINYAIELGIIGLFLFLLMLGKMLKNQFRLYKKTKDEFYLIQFALLLGIFISDMSSQDLYLNKYSLIIFIIASLKHDDNNLKRLKK